MHVTGSNHRYVVYYYAGIIGGKPTWITKQSENKSNVNMSCQLCQNTIADRSVVVSSVRWIKLVLTVMNKFTPWLDAVPIKDILADIFFAAWIPKFGTPAMIVSKQRSQFKALTKLVLCEKTRIMAYQPAWSKILQWWHKSLKAGVMRYWRNHDWSNIFLTLLLGLRNAIKEDLGTSSVELAHGTFS